MSNHTAGHVLVVAAPSGAGKTSLVNALVAREQNIVLSVSHTTREPRPGEIDGQHYHFVDNAEFDRLLEEGEFFEHAEVFGHWYGTSRSAVMKEVARDRDVILEIDWQGARQVKNQLPNAISVFILPPSRKALEARLQARGQDAPDIIANRMAAAKAEMSHYQEFDYLVVNDDFKHALSDLHSILRAARLETPLQRQRHGALVESLLA